MSDNVCVSGYCFLYYHDLCQGVTLGTDFRLASAEKVEENRAYVAKKSGRKPETKRYDQSLFS